jgi:hypothetical protein
LLFPSLPSSLFPVPSSLLPPPLPPQDLLLVISYNKGKVDLKLWETTDKFLHKKLFEINYTSENRKYKCKKKVHREQREEQEESEEGAERE